MNEPRELGPFEPTEADPWDRRKVAHLYRRAGFGARVGEGSITIAGGNRVGSRER